MQTIGWIAAALLSSTLAQAGAPALPAGTWAGTAEWRGAGQSTGEYAVERTFAGATMTSRFAWSRPDGKARKEDVVLTFSPGEGPFFAVVDDKGTAIGKGYCYGETCAYRAALGPVEIDESFRWANGEMTVLGAKSGAQLKVVWKETLRAR